MPPAAMLAGIMQHIVPLIIDSVQDACDAYDRTGKPNGDNFATAYTFGTGCFGYLDSRVDQLLKDDSGFKVESVNNITRIVWTSEEAVFRFHLNRVEPDSRLFKSGNGIKAVLREKWRQCWLFPEDEARSLAPDGYIHNLGYDASPENGLGRITLDRIRHLSGADYEVKTLYEFELDHDDPGKGSRMDAAHHDPERIRRASPSYNPPHGADRASSE